MSDKKRQHLSAIIAAPTTPPLPSREISWRDLNVEIEQACLDSSYNDETARNTSYEGRNDTSPFTATQNPRHTFHTFARNGNCKPDQISWRNLSLQEAIESAKRNSASDYPFVEENNQRCSSVGNDHLPQSSNSSLHTQTQDDTITENINNLISTNNYHSSRENVLSQRLPQNQLHQESVSCNNKDTRHLHLRQGNQLQHQLPNQLSWRNNSIQQALEQAKLNSYSWRNLGDVVEDVKCLSNNLDSSVESMGNCVVDVAGIHQSYEAGGMEAVQEMLNESQRSGIGESGENYDRSTSIVSSSRNSRVSNLSNTSHSNLSNTSNHRGWDNLDGLDEAMERAIQNSITLNRGEDCHQNYDDNNSMNVSDTDDPETHSSNEVDVFDEINDSVRSNLSSRSDPASLIAQKSNRRRSSAHREGSISNDRNNSVSSGVGGRTSSGTEVVEHIDEPAPHLSIASHVNAERRLRRDRERREERQERGSDVGDNHRRGLGERIRSIGGLSFRNLLEAEVQVAGATSSDNNAEGSSESSSVTRRGRFTLKNLRLRKKKKSRNPSSSSVVGGDGEH